eukprot:m.78198 g.78198  ORF g.78198 m.78198 type:complete len:318 (+) comp36090_c1_seq1:151-1104(+)
MQNGADRRRDGDARQRTKRKLKRRYKTKGKENSALVEKHIKKARDTSMKCVGQSEDSLPRSYAIFSNARLTTGIGMFGNAVTSRVAERKHDSPCPGKRAEMEITESPELMDLEPEMARTATPKLQLDLRVVAKRITSSLPILNQRSRLEVVKRKIGDVYRESMGRHSQVSSVVEKAEETGSALSCFAGNEVKKEESGSVWEKLFSDEAQGKEAYIFAEKLFGSETSKDFYKDETEFRMQIGQLDQYKPVYEMTTQEELSEPCTFVPVEDEPELSEKESEVQVDLHPFMNHPEWSSTRLPSYLLAPTPSPKLYPRRLY